MAEITAKMVKELREITGAGMMECKKALAEAEGNMESAIDVLRTRGLAAVAKKAGRATNEGTIAAAINDSCTKGAMIELDCETDFVAINEKFKGYANRIAQSALESSPKDVEELKKAKCGDETVEDVLTDCIHVLGENCQLSRVGELEADGVCSYLHEGGRIGVLVGFSLEGIDPKSEGFVRCAKDVAMQVAAMNPVALNRDSVPADVRAHEMEIYKAQAAESGKPENIQEKIAEGRMQKFYKENCLTEQDFVKDGDITINQYIDNCAKELGGKIVASGYLRFQMGE